MDLKVPEKEFRELSWKATSLEWLERFIKNLTEKERNDFTAGDLADVLVKIIENTRRQSE